MSAGVTNARSVAGGVETVTGTIDDDVTIAYYNGDELITESYLFSPATITVQKNSIIYCYAQSVQMSRFSGGIEQLTNFGMNIFFVTGDFRFYVSGGVAPP